MRLLYVVQRYGAEIVGGSEAACRQFAEALSSSGHVVEVLTSCARSYVTWENSYDPGTTEVNGVLVHRLPVIAPRKPERFGPTDIWLMSETSSPLVFEQQRWARQMGPDLDGMRSWLIANCDRFDAVIFMTYLYTTASMGIAAVAGRVPVVLQPTAHDEPSLKMHLFESVFRLPDAFLYFTPEEETVVKRRFRIDPPGRVVGIGIDLEPPKNDASSFREKQKLEKDPYLIYVGRLDLMKGVKQLCDFFIAVKDMHRIPLKLVLAGEELVELPTHPDIIITGFLDEPEKQGAISDSLALVQPSYFESFSIVLCEAWVQCRPALVQGASTVLRGQAVRSSGAIPYEGFAQFEQAVMMLLEDPTLAQRLGENGRLYVESTYNWSSVLTGVEECLALASEHFGRRPVQLSRGK